MLVLTDSNSYSFANMVVRVTDNTIAVDDTITPTPDTPEFNMLIPIHTDVGSTNTMELYYPGEPNRFLNAHGNPNPLKYGFGPDTIYSVLSKSSSNVGIYTINLRGNSATNANIIVYMKYKIEKDVPYTTTEGEQYYVHPNGQIDNVSTDGEAIKRDVLHLKFESCALKGCKSWVDMNDAMNSLYRELPAAGATLSGFKLGEDKEMVPAVAEDDYGIIPWFGVMYRGASDYGNNIYFTMTPHVAEYDDKTYYSLKLFNGEKTVITDNNYSMDINSGKTYNTTYYIENRFNDDFGSTLRYMSAESSTEIADLINKYLYTVDDVVSGNEPSKSFEYIDPFTADYFGVVVDEGSINTVANKAFSLSEGNNGDETADELYEAFFKGEIVTDIASVLRYRISYIPDIGYNESTVKAIEELVTKRNRMTTATIMLGGNDFQSALLEHQAEHYETAPNIRQIARVQSAMMYNDFIRRTIRYPASYFDTVALTEHFSRYGNYYQPFAGANARWTGYIEDTMKYPAETVDYINSLTTNRINVVMKDASPGAYLADQQMNTALQSDQTELNNAFLVSNMLYDLVNLVHANHFKFNEADEVRVFKEAVNDNINSKYSEYSASLETEVYRMGTIGRAKSANKITVTINMRDINKWTDVDIILTDE